MPFFLWLKSTSDKFTDRSTHIYFLSGHVFCCACDNEVIPNATNSFKAKGINLSFILFTSLFIVSVTMASGDFSANLFSSLIVFSSKTNRLDVSFSNDFSRLSNLTTLIRFLSLPFNLFFHKCFRGHYLF